nr:protein RoBo-1-like [Meriones unguiculatus]
MAWSSILKRLLPVFVFAILAVSSVESYTCVVSACNEETCPGPTTSCTATKGCFSRMMKSETPSTLSDLMLNQKGCTSDADTCSNLEFSATLGDQRTFRYKNRCCTTGQCNKENITVHAKCIPPDGSPALKSISSLPVVLLLLKVLL